MMGAYSDQFEPYGEPEPFARSVPPGLTCDRCGYHTTNGMYMSLHLLGCLNEPEIEQEKRSEPLEPLAVLLEAELVLMQHWASRHGCRCARHQSWLVVE